MASHLEGLGAWWHLRARLVGLGAGDSLCEFLGRHQLTDAGPPIPTGPTSMLVWQGWANCRLMRCTIKPPRSKGVLTSSGLWTIAPVSTWMRTARANCDSPTALQRGAGVEDRVRTATELPGQRNSRIRIILPRLVQPEPVDHSAHALHALVHR